MSKPESLGDCTPHANPRTLTEFVENCEAIITFQGFVQPKDRDRARVFSLAKLIGIAASLSHIEEMLLAVPGLYEGLLRCYLSLITSRGIAWWQSNEHAAHVAWPRAVRDSITAVAVTAGVDPKDLARVLDAGYLPRTRQHILSLAERRLQACP